MPQLRHPIQRIVVVGRGSFFCPSCQGRRDHDPRPHRGELPPGKTTVAQILVDLGAQLVEADDVGRQVVEPGTIGLERVVEAFGPEVLTPSGSLNRKLVGRLVFQDSAKLQLLNSILHPLMEEEMRRQLVLLEPRALWCCLQLSFRSRMG